MRTALGRVNIIGKADNIFTIPVIILHCHLGLTVFTHGVYIDNLLMDRLLIAVFVLNKFFDTAVIAQINLALIFGRIFSCVF